jgi:uncharacterized cysteine cluster protein YcgN (CxxCxxCC family)
MESFWEKKSLEEMTIEEWEALCDGCAKCCLHKIEDDETGQVYYTRVACQLLDVDQCRCMDYENRSKFVSDCLQLTPKAVRENDWLPKSCAYRRLAEGRGLAWWHPLISGEQMTVPKICSAIYGKILPEKRIDLSQLEGLIIDWFEED